MTDLLERLRAIDPVSDDEVRSASRDLAGLPARIVASAERAGRPSLPPLVRRRAIGVAIAAVLAVAVAAPLIVLSPLGTGGEPAGLGPDGWFRVGSLDELAPAVYLEEYGIFVMTTAAGDPYALMAVSPHLPEERKQVWLCTAPDGMPAAFFSPSEGSRFAPDGRYASGPSPSDLFPGSLRITPDGFVEVDTRAHPAPSIQRTGLGTGSLVDPCTSGWRVESPGIARPDTGSYPNIPVGPVPVPGGTSDLTLTPPTPPEVEPEGTSGGGTIAARNITFSVEEIHVAADTPTTLVMLNQDEGVPHNISIYADDTQREPSFAGEIFVGVDRLRYELPALVAGRYVFVCDVHPTTMRGTLVAS